MKAAKVEEEKSHDAQGNSRLGFFLKDEAKRLEGLATDAGTSVEHVDVKVDYEKFRTAEVGGGHETLQHSHKCSPVFCCSDLICLDPQLVSVLNSVLTRFFSINLSSVVGNGDGDSGKVGADDKYTHGGVGG